MPDAPTRVDLFRIGADDILARSALRPPGQRVDPTQVDTPGSDINIVTASASAMNEEVLRQMIVRVNALFLDGAKGEDLDRLVSDRFSPTVVRKEATPAVGIVSFSRTTGAVPGGTIAQGTHVKTANGVEFELLTDVPFPAASNGPVTGSVQAIDAGSAGNVAVGEVNQFSSPPFDPNIQVTNPEVMAGGDDEETDARLRDRAKNFFLTARRGTLAAIEFGALTVAGVRLATAVELTDENGDPTGHVALYISDSAGNGNASLVNAVRAALIEYRAAGVIVDVQAAVPVFVTIEFRLRFGAGVDSTGAFNQIRISTVASVNQLAPNQTLERSLLTSVARSIPGVIVLDDAIVQPAGDLVPAPGQVIRTRQDLVILAP